MKFKNLTKKLAAGLLAVSMLFVGTNTPVSAADESASYVVYYNSPASYKLTTYCTLPFYGGTQTFKVATYTGTNTGAIISCAGENVSMTTMYFTGVGTRGFTCTLINGGSTEKFLISLNRNTTSTTSTSNITGKIYY